MLTLIKPGPDDADAKNLEAQRIIVRACLQDVWNMVKEGEIEDVCVLGVGDGCVEILNTIPDLGELGLARDELTDMINEARRDDL